MVNRNLIRSLENDPDLNALFEAEVAQVEDSGSMLGTMEAEGNFDVSLPVNATDEIGTLARAFQALWGTKQHRKSLFLPTH